MMRKALGRLAVAATGLLLMTGCDSVAEQVLDTILLAFDIVSVWV